MAPKSSRLRLLLAQAWLLALPANASASERVLSLTTGYRVDKLNWNIASDETGSTTPNVLSELTWSRLQIYQARLEARIVTEMRIYSRASLAYGLILNGRNQDSDYLGNNRTQEFSRSNNQAGHGRVLDAVVGYGYQFRPDNAGLSLSPIGGLSFHSQNLFITDGNQTVPADGPFPNLRSTYTTEWFGPWLGLDIAVKNGKVVLNARASHHWATYNATANWNLRNDFRHPNSYEHNARGTGVVASGGLEYALASAWTLHIGGQYQYWRTRPGVDTVHFVNGVDVSTRLNRVTWSSGEATAGISYNF